jgi:transglutaminase-like putative cysteine protease
MRNFLLIAFFVFVLYAISATAQENKQEIKELAINIAGKNGSSMAKAERLHTWMYKNFKFLYTDYQKRTIAEIIKRRGENCAELARVFQTLLGKVDVPTRWIVEITIVLKSEQRQKNAERLIAKRGVRASVFGYMHNDHRWLEVYNDINKTWFPADPSTGIFGTDSLVRMRIGFGERPEVMKGWIVPFVVVGEKKKKIIAERSEY